jgi:hypothetical protein
MKKKRWILSLLLSAFMLVAFHDFVIQYYDADTQVELSLKQTHGQTVCDMSNIHEQIHHSMMLYNVNNTVFLVEASYFSPYFIKKTQLIQTFKQSIYRPPIA